MMYRTILAAVMLLSATTPGSWAAAQTSAANACLDASPPPLLVGATVTQPGLGPSLDNSEPPFWFSRGETIRVIVSRQALDGFDLGKSLVTVFLRWTGSTSEFKAIYPAVSLANDQLTVDFVIPANLAPAPDAVQRVGFGIVPTLDFCMTATSAAQAGGPQSVTPLFLVRETLGITSHTYATLGGLLVITVVVLLLALIPIQGLITRNPILRIIATTDGTASLSQFQLLFWTLVIGGCATYVMALHGRLIDISDGTLTLLGISAVSALGTQMKGSIDAKRNPGAQSQTVVAQPRWIDLVITGEQIDVTRVQMIFFTVMSAFFVLLKVGATDAIPEIPANYLLLMGISNGVYFAAKYTTTTPSPESQTTANPPPPPAS